MLVVSSIDCHTNKLSKFVDYYLQLHAKALLYYVQDTIDFIKKLETVKGIKIIHPSHFGCVSTLHKHFLRQGHTSCEKKLNNQTSTSIATQVIVKFLCVILTLNNFIFNGINYLQIKGCAMGTICASTYANIFLGKFKLHIYPYIGNISKFCCRYIDIFFL